jgi:hypothetical protein
VVKSEFGKVIDYIKRNNADVSIGECVIEDQDVYTITKKGEFSFLRIRVYTGIHYTTREYVPNKHTKIVLQYRNKGSETYSRAKLSVAIRWNETEVEGLKKIGYYKKVAYFMQKYIEIMLSVVPPQDTETLVWSKKRNCFAYQLKKDKVKD